jgi:transcriptional regulator with XRE-family HTH domain
MDVAKNIKRIREKKGMSQKELITAVGLGAPMYSRIETGKAEPSLTTLEKIAKALNVKLSDFFDNDTNLEDINSYDSDLVDKIKMIEILNEEEKKTVFSIVDAFIGKKKLKDALNNVLTEVNS